VDGEEVRGLRGGERQRARVEGILALLPNSTYTPRRFCHRHIIGELPHVCAPDHRRSQVLGLQPHGSAGHREFRFATAEPC
jgi:hypothetical protein